MVSYMKDHMSRRRVLVGLGGMAAVGLAGCTEDATDHSAGAQPDQSMDVEIVEHELQRDDLDNAAIDVLIENTGDESINYLEAQAVVHNAANERVGDGLANTTNVPAGERVRFDVMTTVDFEAVDHYEVEARTNAM